MKNIIFLVLIILFSCIGKSQNLKVDKTYYSINYDTNIPYEIFVNGISIARSYNLKGQEGGYRILNPFIEKTGNQNITIKLLVKNEALLTKDFLSRQKFEIYTFDDIDNPQKINLLKKIDINENSIKL